MSPNGKRFSKGNGAGRSGRVRVYTRYRPWQERVEGQVHWPLQEILRHTREEYPVKR